MFLGADGCSGCSAAFIWVLLLPSGVFLVSGWVVVVLFNAFRSDTQAKNPLLQKDSSDRLFPIPTRSRSAVAHAGLGLLEERGALHPLGSPADSPCQLCPCQIPWSECVVNLYKRCVRKSVGAAQWGGIRGMQGCTRVSAWEPAAFTARAPAPRCVCVPIMCWEWFFFSVWNTSRGFYLITGKGRIKSFLDTTEMSGNYPSINIPFPKFG